MRHRNRAKENFTCWICDYGYIIITILLILIIGALIRFHPFSSGSISNLPLDDPGLEPNSPIEVEITQTEQYIPTEILIEATETITPDITSDITPTLISEKPEFIIAFIPVHWSGAIEAFRDDSKEQFDHFVRESHIDSYFNVTYALIEENLTNSALDDPNLVLDVIEFGLLREPADRYVGLTDGDLGMDGDYFVAGWTMGEDFLGVVGEANYLAITSHELGHTFGLCDEYSYSAWYEQDLIADDGCPNPFPAECNPELDLCEQNPDINGNYSIMGFALESYQVFNEYCLLGLQEKFEEMVRREP